MNIFCIGINHRTAAVSLRERFAVGEGSMSSLLADLRREASLGEAVVLSTCNRVEVYGLSGDDEASARACADYLQRAAGAEADFYRREQAEGARHLFRVVCGLDSMVVGETEILGQVKDAYAVALESGSTGAALNRLFQQAFRVAKQVRTETGITRGAVSVGSVAVELAEKIFGDLAGCRVLLLGAGKAGARVARSLRSRGVRRLILANRTFDRAAELASELEGMALHFDRWKTALNDVDIVISSTAARGRLLAPEELSPLMSARGDRPLFLVDLAVPRDFDPALNGLEGVFLHDIDSLQAMAQRGMQARASEVERCEDLIEAQVKEFLAWVRQRPGAAKPSLSNAP
ncbi:MAG: glutamyl-tRNA reductase [Chthoniobacterales bacterium]|jgi:glutamyl-tRNA reductase